MNDASATGIVATVTPEKPPHTSGTLDAVQSSAITLREADEGTGTAVTSDVIQPRPERRRPGPRIANTNEPLIPLLRGDRESPQDCAAMRGDDMAPANGIVMGLLISGVFWLVILFILR